MTGCGGMENVSGFGGIGDNARLSQLRAHYEVQLRYKSDELREMQNRMNQLEIETAQVRASWEIERRNLVRQIGHYRAVLERYCIPLEEAGGGGTGSSSNAYNTVDEGQGMYFSSFEPSAPSQWCTGKPPATTGATGGQSTSGFAASSPAGFAGSSGSSAAAFAGPLRSASASSAPALSSERPPFLGSPQQPVFSGGNNTGSPIDAAQQASSLDTKMRQLNNLLQEGQAASQRRRSTSDGPTDAEQAPREAAASGPEGSRCGGTNGGGYSSGSIASTLRAMFPHATIRTRAASDGTDNVPDGAEGKVSADAAVSSMAATAYVQEQEAWSMEQHVRRLERSTGGQVDDRAMRALQMLSTKDAKEALQKVDELVHAQGGHCRNLSSILQSVCRKIEKRSFKANREDDTSRGFGVGANSEVSASGSRSGTGGRSGGESGRSSRRARRLDEDGDAFDSSESDGDASGKVSHANRSLSWPQASEPALLRTQSVNTADTPAGKSNKSWADIQSGDEEDAKEAAVESGLGGDFQAMSGDHEEENEHWTVARVEKYARRGFELRRRGDHWDLKISMGGLDPPLTEPGMERYCRWLRVRLTSFRSEHGPESLRRCRGEVDFSHNSMSNQMVWMLLETLAQHEVHTALLKLFANHISQGGVLAICEFIRMNERAEALQELHLSHNEIDDDSALELLRTLNFQRPRYPPRRSCEGTGEPLLAPVWLRLNHNRIRDPDNVRRAAEAEGITICTAWDRQACGTSKCCRRECPLVHLYSFSVQARRRPSPVPRADMEDPRDYDANGEARGSRRKRGKRPLLGVKERDEYPEGSNGIDDSAKNYVNEQDGRYRACGEQELFYVRNRHMWWSECKSAADSSTG